jgi:hypothetical protein
MTNINFDEPSRGEVNADNEEALEVTNNGKGGVGVRGLGLEDNGEGVRGDSNNGVGVRGFCKSAGMGVVGSCEGKNGLGVWGVCLEDKGEGVRGDSNNGVGVRGFCKSAGMGVVGSCDGKNGLGVWGVCLEDKGEGVRGDSNNGVGVRGFCKSAGAGVVGSCDGVAGIGVFGQANAENSVGVKGEGPIAGRFIGNVEVTGDIRLLNADCAEDFDILEEDVEPGTVMVLSENGSLHSSTQEYDKKVTGIVSGSGGYKPAIILGSHNLQSQNEMKESKDKNRLPIALMGKVYCKVDARHASIEIGDLLTTSSTKGHAMKAGDPLKAFGAVIGKALGSIKGGFGSIPVLVTLQ